MAIQHVRRHRSLRLPPPPKKVDRQAVREDSAIVVWFSGHNPCRSLPRNDGLAFRLVFRSDRLYVPVE